MTDTLTRLPLVDMQIEVREVTTANGWYDTDRSLLEGVGLILSESVEALEAFRRWGLEDATFQACAAPHRPVQAEQHVCKPEGVGSELADVLIRLLDEASRQHVSTVLWGVAGTVQLGEGSFVDNLHTLNKAILRLEHPSTVNFATVYAALTAIAERWGIDLAREYTRKVAYNRTRSHRHGGKRL